MVLLSMSIAVCASSRPLTEAPVCSVIDVWLSTTPSRCAVVPRVTAPLTCQKTFLASAPPVRVTLVPLLTVRSWAIWKIQTSVALPASVRSMGISRPVLHL